MEQVVDAIPALSVADPATHAKTAPALDVGPFLRQEGRPPVAISDSRLTRANSFRVFPGQKYVSSPLRPGPGWMTSLMKRVGYTH
jgi:hypothetical protein